MLPSLEQRLGHEPDAVRERGDPGDLDQDDQGEDGDVVQSTTQEYRTLNVGFVAAMVWCVACWAALAYVIGLMVG